MNWCIRLIVVVLVSGLVIGCKQGDTQGQEKKQIIVTKDDLHEYPDALTVEKGSFSFEENHELSNLLTAEWVDLIPEDELLILLNPPEYLAEIDDGSFEDKILDKIKNTHQGELSELSSYEQALVSSNTIQALDGVNIRIPGFVVPLEINEQQVITRFFVVPYFGACIHLPPPAPNQMIHIEIKQGIHLETIYEPIWVSGKLSTTLIADEMATSAYSMEIYVIESYDERD